MFVVYVQTYNVVLNLLCITLYDRYFNSIIVACNMCVVVLSEETVNFTEMS